MKTITCEDGEHDALRDLVSWAYTSNYYHNRLDTDTFDSMANNKWKQIMLSTTVT